MPINYPRLKEKCRQTRDGAKAMGMQKLAETMDSVIDMLEMQEKVCR